VIVMGNHVGDRVVVLGGSMAGVLAARVLAEAYAEVLVVDRDQLAGVTGYRRGVPHGRHAHGLVARGHQILEGQFPGLTQDLIAAGVRPGDFNGDIRWYFNGRRIRPGESGLLSVPATRPILEHHVRERVRAIPNVTFLERHDILGLESTSDGSRILGVRVQRQAEGGTADVLFADLVVDTTGRGSRTPAWLAELGYPRPEEDRVKIGLAYTTRHYRLRSDPFDGDLAIIPAATPEHPRGAFFYYLPDSTDCVELSLTGILGDHPPTDPDGFLAFVKSLPIPEIYHAIRDAEPLDDPVSFRYPASIRRRYERLARFPAGLLVMGDAVCSFNPIYAQGMTAAALESLALQRRLALGVEPQPLAFFADIAGEIDSPWEFSAGADLGYAGVEGRRTAKIRIANAYVARLQRAATHDATLTNAFIRVAGLIDPPQALLRPGNALRVLRHGRKTPAGLPPQLDEQQVASAAPTP
jgi:2-polyprenyl-6-methoxyphenol hydroxylase-like FAD-dependent oxidoreductase